MSKTITVRLKDKDYRRVKEAATSENRTISNFIHTHLLHNILEENFVDEREMKLINEEKEFQNNIKSALSDISKGKYKIIS